MILSNTSKYAIRAVIYLAIKSKNKQKTGIKKIAEELNIPAPFLSKILQVLAKKKILSSSKGPQGGFGIGKKLSDISLYDIIVEINGKDLFNSCLLNAGSCDNNLEKNFCALHAQFEQSRNEMIRLFREKTIQELASEANAQEFEISL